MIFALMFASLSGLVIGVALRKIVSKNVNKEYYPIPEVPAPYVGMNIPEHMKY